MSNDHHMTEQDPHRNQAVLTTGASLDDASAAMIMVHGRGASARDILGLSGRLQVEGFAFLAPQAAGNTWYPYSFLNPISDNEPWLTSALATVSRVLRDVQGAGIPAERTMLLGFSQGACLTTEYAARNPHRYGGIVGLSGGLIGPPGTPRNYSGTLDGTPVFLGCSDVDFHIPKERVLETEDVLRNLGADVTARLYPGMGHTINDDEIAHAQRMMARLANVDS